MLAKPDFTTRYFSVPSRTEGHFKLTNENHAPNLCNVNLQFYYTI